MEALTGKNYVVYHLHSDLSNGVTNIDSVTKFGEYIEKAASLGMKTLGFSEHGSVFAWLDKKEEIEKAGMKYIHGAEVYVTATLEEKVRDNMHCVLLAKDFDGLLELNRLISASFDREDGHFYYVPRITLDELFGTSDHLIVTTACVGGILNKGTEADQTAMLDFCEQHKDRCFLEIGHHIDQKQVEYNKRMLTYSRERGIRLIAGTDTHALNRQHERGRSILQISKNIHFDGEENWNLQFLSYDELVAEYRRQDALPEEVYLEAIENTNIMADMISEYDIDKSIKYPHIYDNPEETFVKKIDEAIATHPYATKNHTMDEIRQRVQSELDVYKTVGAIDFMLLEVYMREWERSHGIQCGYGRGSVSGSFIAYLLGITQMDSIKYDLNFFRFMNPSRVTCADIDTDYSGEDRTKIKEFLLRDRMNLPQIRTAEIITYNTIALKGAIRDVGRALEIPLGEVGEICKHCVNDGKGDVAPDQLRWKYPELFEYVDIVNGTIVSIGSHPSGVLVSDLNIEETIGLCSIKSSEYPVTMLDMHQLDALSYVKLDILGLDNIGVINKTCEMVGIERLTPDNVDIEDEAVWQSIRDDTTLIFQWESVSASKYLKKFMSDHTIQIAKERIKNFSYIKWLSFGNGLIRPACASFRDEVADGVFYDNGFDELNDFLAQEAGRIAMQETIMKVLKVFCGYSDAESDNVRRAVAKKKGTETLLPEIEQRFVDYSTVKYNLSKDKAKEIVKPLIQVILDASSYAFSWNHSDSYSFIGYICGYLRYYYPLEFITAALNTFEDNADKTAQIAKYATKHDIKITSPKYGSSRSGYYFNKESRTISKGLASVKYMSGKAADELYNLSTSKKYNYFSDLLYDISTQTTLDSRQLDILLKIDFFSDFGNQRELFAINDIFCFFKQGSARQIKKTAVDGTQFEEAVRRHSTDKKKDGTEAKSYTLLDPMAIVRECEDEVKRIGMSDLSLVLKARNFVEAMGYPGYFTGQEQDRNKLYIRDVFPVKRRSDGEIFAYNVLTFSLGSGIEASMTVFKGPFEKEPIKKDDIITCKGWKRDGKWFRMTDYEHFVA